MIAYTVPLVPFAFPLAVLGRLDSVCRACVVLLPARKSSSPHLPTLSTATLYDGDPAHESTLHQPRVRLFGRHRISSEFHGILRISTSHQGFRINGKSGKRCLRRPSQQDRESPLLSHQDSGVYGEEAKPSPHGVLGGPHPPSSS